MKLIICKHGTWYRRVNWPLFEVETNRAKTLFSAIAWAIVALRFSRVTSATVRAGMSFRANSRSALIVNSPRKWCTRPFTTPTIDGTVFMPRTRDSSRFHEASEWPAPKPCLSSSYVIKITIQLSNHLKHNYIIPMFLISCLKFCHVLSTVMQEKQKSVYE